MSLSEGEQLNDVTTRVFDRRQSVAWRLREHEAEFGRKLKSLESRATEARKMYEQHGGVTSVMLWSLERDAKEAQALIDTIRTETQEIAMFDWLVDSVEDRPAVGADSVS